MNNFESTPEERAAIGSPGQIYAENAPSSLLNETVTPAIKKVEFDKGRTSYEIVGERNAERNPYLYIPGFAGSFTGVEELARELSAGEDQVIIAGQPGYKKMDRLKEGKVFTDADILDLHADAILAIIEAEGLAHAPLDIVCHSLGTLILQKAAEKAKEKGYTCFDSEAGSHSYAIAPAGLVPDENLRRMAGRYVKFISHDGKFGKKYDPGKKIMKANTKVLAKAPLKTGREVASLLKTKVDLDKLGEIGLKPFVLVMGNDRMFPYEGEKGQVGPTLEQALDQERIEGMASPVDPNYGRVDDAKDERWLDNNSNSGHGDVSYHPKRIASAIRQIRALQYNQHRLHG